MNGTSKNNDSVYFDVNYVCVCSLTIGYCLYIMCVYQGFPQDFSIVLLVSIFKLAQKSGQSPCTIVQGLWPNFMKNEKKRILHFNNFF